MTTAVFSCEPTPSAQYAGRASAWCHGHIVRPPQKSPVASDHSDICMLAPVHAPNFGHLAHRLEQTELLAIGRVPTTVAVFDDPSESASFCRKFPRPCTSPHFVRLDLKSLVGSEAFLAAVGMLKTGGAASREKLRERLHAGDALARECFPKFGGQCYQSLKKFYGAADGPSQCRVYWVSDAETYPFRPFNWSTLVAKTVSRPAAASSTPATTSTRSSSSTAATTATLTTTITTTSSAAAASSANDALHYHRHAKPFLLVPSWHENRYGCGATSNLYDDADCAVWISARLGLDDGSVGEAGVPSSSRRAYQTIYDLNNWWFYERTMARALIDRTEMVTRQHFVPFFASLQVPDINFWRANFELLSRQTGSTMVSRDYLKLVERAFPLAFERCCACTRPARHWNAAGGLREGLSSGGSRNAAARPPPIINASMDLLPCYGLEHLWSPCFLAHAKPSALTAFLVDTLGIFGIFGNEIDQVPHSVLSADRRISWVVNNAYRWSKARTYVEKQRSAPGG